MKKAALLALSILVIAVMARSSQQSEPPKEIPLPAEIDRFHDLMKQLEQTSRLNPREKEAVRAQADKVQIQFDRVWQPLTDSYDELIETSKTQRLKEEDIDKKIHTHNINRRTFRLPDEQAAYNAYNQEAARLNAERKELEERHAREKKRLVQRMQAKAKQVDKWLVGPALKDFMKKGQGLLSGQIRFNKGLAWDQLVYVSGGGSSPDFGDAGGISSVVDTTGVRPLTPEERQTEWKQPGHQMPLNSRRKTTAPPAPKPKP